MLSEETLGSLLKMKDHLATFLHRKGFIATPACKDREANADNTKLVLAVVASGLLPNVAVASKEVDNLIDYWKTNVFATHGDGRVHARSVNADVDFYKDVLVFGRKEISYMKWMHGMTFLHDCSKVPRLAIEIFGDADVRKYVRYREGSIISEVSYTDFPEIIREEIHRVLNMRLNNPSPPIGARLRGNASSSRQLSD
jgi:hypothetical protein